LGVFEVYCGDDQLCGYDGSIKLTKINVQVNASITIN
jgi:hypothetical protein